MKTTKILKKAQCLRELAEEFGLHGLYFQHAALCRRRAWLHLAGATHALHNTRVLRGLALHETEKKPDSVPKGLGIWPDAIDFRRRVVIERKGSDRGKEAVARQVLFYAAFMTGATGELWQAEVHVYGSHKKTEYDLTESVLDELIRDARDAKELAQGAAPAARRIPLCHTCSCNVLCWEA